MERMLISPVGMNKTLTVSSMTCQLTEAKEMIVKSILSVPCTEAELYERDFLKNKSKEIIGRFICYLEIDGLIYYRGDSEVMHISKTVLKKMMPHIYNEYF